MNQLEESDQDKPDLNKDEELKEDIEIKPESLSAREAYFAMVGIRMMSLSQKYNRSLEDLHKLFFTVSCDWKQLESLLQAE